MIPITENQENALAWWAELSINEMKHYASIYFHGVFSHSMLYQMGNDYIEEIYMGEKQESKLNWHKMFFNTGVLPINRLNLSGENKGKFTLNNWEVILNGRLNIIYFLERKPEDNFRLDYLQSDISDLPEYQAAIKIVAGGMLSEYAIFTKLII